MRWKSSVEFTGFKVVAEVSRNCCAPDRETNRRECPAGRGEKVVVAFEVAFSPDTDLQTFAVGNETQRKSVCISLMQHWYTKDQGTRKNWDMALVCLGLMNLLLT